MKILFRLSVVVGALCAGWLLWWNIGDGTRAHRAKEDLISFAQREPKIEPRDPWGNPYLKAMVRVDGVSTSYFFSRGPDGLSSNPGNDPDDIARWTDLDGWLANVHPSYLNIRRFAIVSVFVAVGTGSALAARRGRHPL
ncbi:MAG: hypothetical protein EOP87_00345 [Verrucomicrobiaceae bacterium]|nr:MAG: hypothetical protein EOP87_00345 [Verrucomicrobiaceae bacterium]